MIASINKELNAAWTVRGDITRVEGSFLFILNNLNYHSEAHGLMNAYRKLYRRGDGRRASTLSLSYCYACGARTHIKYACDDCYDILRRYRYNDPFPGNKRILGIRTISRGSRDIYRAYTRHNNALKVSRVLRVVPRGSALRDIPMSERTPLLPKLFLIRAVDIPKEIAYIIFSTILNLMLDPL